MQQYLSLVLKSLHTTNDNNCDKDNQSDTLIGTGVLPGEDVTNTINSHNKCAMMNKQQPSKIGSVLVYDSLANREFK